MLDFFEPQATASNIELVRYLGADLARVQIDPESLQAALLNLILNAQQALPDGGQLMVRSRSTPGGVAIDLIDNGIGMDKDNLRKCFLPHATSKITDFEDIYRSKSLGFRGEALASIAAVSRFTIESRSESEDVGFISFIEGGVEKEKRESVFIPFL